MSEATSDTGRTVADAEGPSTNPAMPLWPRWRFGSTSMAPGSRSSAAT